MNVNKAIWVVCGTAVTISLLFVLKSLIPSAPERITSEERVLMQPERLTSTERVETNRMAAAERVVEMTQSNVMAFQVQQQIEAQQRLSNYNLAKAELAAEWIRTLDELKAKKKTDQISMTLAHMELKGRIAAKYGVSLDSSEPVVPTPVAPAPVVIVQNQTLSPTRSRPASQDEFRRRYGISQTPSVPTPRIKSDDTSLSILKQQYRVMERQMWAIEKTEHCYQKFPDGSFRKLNPTTRHWTIVPESEYNPSYDNIRLPKDQLLIKINQIDPSFH